MYAGWIRRRRLLGELVNKENSGVQIMKHEKNPTIWRQCKSKHRYKDEHTANQFRKKCERERGVKLDYYWCGHCGGFHLTSREYSYNFANAAMV